MIPDVGYHVPEFPEHYNHYNIQDITVYVKKNVNTVNEKLEFIANSFFFITTLNVKGVDA